MLTKEEIAGLRTRLQSLQDDATQFFNEARPKGAMDYRHRTTWRFEEIEDEAQSESLRQEVKRLSVDVAGAGRGGPLLAEADFQELRHSTRRMLAALRFNSYSHQGVYVHSDEDRVLGVDPPTHYETGFDESEEARVAFLDAAEKMRDLIDLLSPSTSTPPVAGSVSYRPNTASS